MDRLTVLQEVFDRTQALADRYQTGGPAYAIHGRDILTSRPGVRDGWELGVLHRTVVQIAEAHDGCAADGCRICSSVREGLAVSLRALRGMQAGELERSVAKPIPRWRQWLWERLGWDSPVG